MKSSYEIGDVLDWYGNKVLIIGQPRRQSNAGPELEAAVIYLTTGNGGVRADVGEVHPRFRLNGKAHWEGELTDEEAAMAVKYLLIGSA